MNTLRPGGQLPALARTRFSLTVMTLNVRVIYMAVFEYQNQVIFNMTVF
jgi:hypothetical protein